MIGRLCSEIFISMLKNARHENHKKQDEKDYNIPTKVSKRY
jgi:hypothetical protein